MVFRSRCKEYVNIISSLLGKATLILEPIGDALITPSDKRVNMGEEG